ncbi:efflux RND transporter periplasmic adaptor subunit [Chitinasiproducens palmae]|uniref:Membrane fusion protein, multidrug efflux system n=1 Tax=Chitinasiproducens palmae TaxID=1770053 RepID=A0A1H2PUW6_9BURK|nr:efflux RND transporter periplasmic adaptor subunit [Chitinasiproducens palmae]SDV50650.1 membrane fusion protein, multidrug efflux system [Chitinasiproducens palmae]
MSTIQPPRTKRTLLSVAAAVVATGAAIAVFHSHSGPTAVSTAAAAAPPAATPVDVAKVVDRTVTDEQSYSGRLQAVDRVELRPLVSGTIVAVHFRDGAMVKKGDPLFSIDPRPYAAEVARASAQLAAAQAQSSYASADAARAQRLLNDNAIAKRDFDDKQSGSQAAQANVKAAAAALEAARINLGYTRIVAPVSGRVSRAELTVGNVVAAGANAPVLTRLVSVSPIYGEFDVDEQTYLRFIGKNARRGGTSVPVRLGLADERGYSRSGVVDSIDNTLDTRSGTIRVRARFDNTDGTLLPGLYARIAVAGNQPHPAVLVSDAAIQTDQDKKFVMVVGSGDKAEYRIVKLGSENDGLRVITDGLKSGERVVVNGLQRVRPNDRVAPNPVPMPNAQGGTGSAGNA